ncbi:ABC transporter permease [Janthinobacterium sp. B9-8]|uniref:ABC transporter permease n=1 Tax=Janthinobacterium sp. B9-8 TaxID=1236179 RepID=UPI00061CEB2A|nr:FtsX-like permease family protein [Janthinobacterium sp. B9-8]AMC33827.1 ABC transporter permease [Janthinobacterium sp. B9-8]
MNIFSLALRNLLRNYRRSLATLLAMLVGAVTILLFGGYSQDLNLGLQTGFVQSSGHLQIQHKDYFLYGNGNPAAYGIAHYPALLSVLKKDPVLAPMLNVITPTLSLGGIAGNYSAGVSRTVLGRGVVVEDQNKLGLWNDYDFPITPKQSALTGTSEDSVVIGTGVARVLALCGALHVKNCPQPAAEANSGSDAPADVMALSEGTGSKAATGRIEMLAANSHGAPNVAALTVVKAETIGVKELDDMFVGLHLSQAQKLIYGAGTPQVTAIVLQLKHSSQMAAARARLAVLMAGPLKAQPLEVLDYTVINPQYGQITGMFAAIFGFIALLIGSIVLFTVSNTMSMAVVERTVEIGTLRAIGLRQSGIRRLFVCEGVLLGAMGAITGVLAALVLAWLVNHSGLTWTPPGNVDPIPLTVRVWGESKMLFTTAFGLVGVALLSAWWPARRAAQLNIVDALRHA